MRTAPAATGKSGLSTDDRRTRQRLRDLCDEVLWSFRLAANEELISETERSEARAFLARMRPAAS
jgi:hypothetical protein